MRWFRNLLVRATPKDRELLQRLWTKAESQGLKSLTQAEKQELRALMGRLEEVLTTPLDRDAKNRLWQWSRAEYFEVHNPQLARLLGAEELKLYQVHHIYPMQYAHLFPKLDINGKANLVGIHKNVHDSISAVWLSLGRTAAARMKPQDVTRVTEIVNRHYKRWFHRIYNPKDADALASAERAALDEVAAIRAALMH